ncbi:DUF2336 domain-containing protein [Varunaivibrio sulfuroxidans]|uniref:Uncharacterized protein (DUF2336 family) n=1 Tax=Varunaivibrio sulfuroxidans TaxID=1773489 RepID=A0A4R3J8E8_9PROT|nr:DUF2336 domain-containing protein [Varunaivibrio sulfuroxidans]TCS61203.1 uncharacterized protein (DUF2336 family) [Varunaivibrio sulfuroxidans]WES31176.1 DUF2336 domain-containing protein [Varunaivibrio sulfuroxidans]
MDSKSIVVEFERLIELAYDKSVKGRSELVSVLGKIFDDGGYPLSEQERALVFAILENIISDVEISVRQQLSERLAERDDVPHTLVSWLANDDIKVAFPVLCRSGLLNDMDLIDVVRARTQEHQLAITLRTELSEEVSSALVHTRNEPVIVSLLNNQNARIAKATLEFLTEESRRIDSFHRPLLLRKELEPRLAIRLFMLVSVALRQYILDHFEIGPEIVNDLLRQMAIDEVSRPSAPPTGKENLVSVLEEEKELTTDLFICALEEGEVALFSGIFSRLTGLKNSLSLQILLDPVGEGLAVACRALDFGEAVFTTIFALVKRHQKGNAQGMINTLPKILKFYRAMSPAAANEVVNKWKKNVSYLEGIRELELGENCA